MSPVVQPMRPLESSIPRKLFLVEQFKQGDTGDPAWSPLKRFFYRQVWCRLMELGLERWKFVQWDHRDKYGNYSWREVQGIFSDEWRAEQEAAKYPHGRCTPITLNEVLPSEGVLATSQHPHAVTRAYERINNRSTVLGTREDERRLINEIKATREVVEANRSLLA